MRRARAREVQRLRLKYEHSLNDLECPSEHLPVSQRLTEPKPHLLFLVFGCPALNLCDVHDPSVSPGQVESGIPSNWRKGLTAERLDESCKCILRCCVAAQRSFN